MRSTSARPRVTQGVLLHHAALHGEARASAISADVTSQMHTLSSGRLRLVVGPSRPPWEAASLSCSLSAVSPPSTKVGQGHRLASCSR